MTSFCENRTPRNFLSIWATPAVASVLLTVGFAVLTSASYADDKEPAKPIRSGIVLQLKSTRIKCGDSVMLAELIDPTDKAAYVGFNHTVRRIGKPDDGNRFLIASPEDYRYVDPKKEFEGLLSYTVFSKPRHLDLERDGMIGVERKITPKHAGVYLLQSEWTAQDLSSIVSIPLILTVTKE